MYFENEIVTNIDTDAASGNLVLQSMQDCDALIDKCKAERLSDKLRGHRKTGSLHCVAELPLVLVETLKAQGLDILHDRAALKKVLNDPEFSAFRTSNGRV